ncbi:hypothetical protein YC2023_023003 [Brassica napus]
MRNYKDQGLIEESGESGLHVECKLRPSRTCNRREIEASLLLPYLFLFPLVRMDNHQTFASSLLDVDDLLHIPAETIGASGEKDDTCPIQSESKGKEVVVVLHDQDAHAPSSVAKKQERSANERLIKEAETSCLLPHSRHSSS